MGAIYHLDKPYTRDVITDSHLSKTSSNSLKNAAVTELVDNVVAPVEEGTTASQAYSAGDELIFNDVLYKAISAIAQGDDLISSGTGQNMDLAGTIVSQLKALFADETVLKRLPQITDLNTPYISEGIRCYPYSSNASNAPTTTYGLLIVFDRTSTASLQFVIPITANAIFMRKKYENTWDTTWKQIYGKSFTQVTGSGTINIENTTSKNILSVTNLEPGTYLFIGRLRYQALADGICGADISTTSATLSDGIYVKSLATASVNTRVEVTKMINISSNSTTIYLVGHQNTGSTVSMVSSGCYLQYYKLT